MTLKNLLKDKNNINTVILCFSDKEYQEKKFKYRKNSIPRKYLYYTVLEYRIYDKYHYIKAILKGNI